MCQHIWSCRHVVIWTDMCYVPTCADMCQHVTSLSAPLIPIIWTLPTSWYVSAHVDMPTCADMYRHVLMCADMCRYVPTCTSTLGISDTNHLDLICMLACVSSCGHADMCWYVPTCADMCWHVTSLSAPLIPIIWTLPTSWYVSAHVDMPTCADMYRHVPTCADMCQHVLALSASLIPTIWTLSACWHVSVHVDMPTCADMCRHVPICANM